MDMDKLLHFLLGPAKTMFGRCVGSAICASISLRWAKWRRNRASVDWIRLWGGCDVEGGVGLAKGLFQAVERWHEVWRLWDGAACVAGGVLGLSDFLWRGLVGRGVEVWVVR